MVKIVEKTTGLIFSVISVVMLFIALPTLWDILSSALDDLATASIPLVSGMTKLIGLLFGATVLILGLKMLLVRFKERSRAYSRGYHAGRKRY